MAKEFLELLNDQYLYLVEPPSTSPTHSPPCLPVWFHP